MDDFLADAYQEQIQFELVNEEFTNHFPDDVLIEEK